MNYAIPIALAEANVRLGELCEKVVEDRETILIHQPNGQDVALIALDELNGLLETAGSFITFLKNCRVVYYCKILNKKVLKEYIRRKRKKAVEFVKRNKNMQ